MMTGQLCNWNGISSIYLALQQIFVKEGKYWFLEFEQQTIFQTFYTVPAFY